MNELITQHQTLLIELVQELEQSLPLSKEKILVLQKKYALPNGKMLSKTDIIAVYRQLAGSHGLQPFSRKVVKQLRMKPSRTISGIAPVTVLTKPYPCPGNCIFCPSNVRMPKSYLPSEPGAQRAEHNYFDPYLQTYNRVQALYDMGHPVDKVELIVLGGSWSSYPLPYQLWFLKECLRALNEFNKKDDRLRLQAHYQQIEKEMSELDMPFISSDSKINEQIFSDYELTGETIKKNQYNQLITDLFFKTEKAVALDKFQTTDWPALVKQQQINEQAKHRCIGLSLETRPDLVDCNEVKKLRRLGCTKVQLGLQSLNDQVLKANYRGHSVATSAQAMKLLRQAGFKIHAHWMPNLLGSSPQQDKQDYVKMFNDERFRPDEIKIYPCTLLQTAPLMKYYQAGQWQPYSEEELLDVLSFCLLNTPEYCRVTRMMRDIPSFAIVDGNKKTNFRQIVQQHLKRLEQKSVDIRAREIRNLEFDVDNIFFKKLEYQTAAAKQIFLQYLVPVKEEIKLLAFLRLSLPRSTAFVKELTAENCAMIREIHVYGQLVRLGQSAQGKAQHLGLGSKLIKRAKQLAADQGYTQLAVISAIGTQEYYRSRKFKDSGLYQIADLSK